MEDIRKLSIEHYQATDVSQITYQHQSAQWTCFQNIIKEQPSVAECYEDNVPETTLNTFVRLFINIKP